MIIVGYSRRLSWQEAVPMKCFHELCHEKPHPQKISRPELKFRANSKSPLKWTEFLIQFSV
ncbi:hypothetical protein CEN42_16465 [Fischerella thermalis CCMEE 5208]|nr:hypothetical protein CEN42_16465 [Fischerella thermalis CCMEE 5208]